MWFYKLLYPQAHAGSKELDSQRYGADLAFSSACCCFALFYFFLKKKSNFRSFNAYFV